MCEPLVKAIHQLAGCNGIAFAETEPKSSISVQSLQKLFHDTKPALLLGNRGIRGCSHIMSDKNGGSRPPSPPARQKTKKNSPPPPPSLQEILVEKVICIARGHSKFRILVFLHVDNLRFLFKGLMDNYDIYPSPNLTL